ncbi:MAG: [FeFe] hydrogenase maturase subunit HydE [Desulfovibrio sp.]|uniref:[FeFe] hydrogenase H-cluster radical SAM maturase HydE n=1 Tax=Christensenella intestinihominis TaxID=1851429 RepID=UPI0008298146|nr:[FeFe] hydrogenase H-cluster radical SAM maturase HydE [Christensenella intestinihominis]
MALYTLGHHELDTRHPDLDILAAVIADGSADRELFHAANRVKTEEFGNKVFVRGIIEFSNYCRCTCAYCGINARMTHAKRYRMLPDELVETAVRTAEVYRTVILQSGEDRFYTAEMLADIVWRIKQRADCAVTLSVGERSMEEYRLMREAGADRFLLKHETANAVLYESLHGVPLETRLDAQRRIKALGFELGGGFMVGLPGQTDETLAKDLMTLVNEGVEMAGIGPFIAHPDTALAGTPDGDPHKTLKVLALARLLLPRCHLPSTTALNVKGGMKNALLCGADVIMQKATPFEYRKLYDIYPGRDALEVPLKEQYETLRRRLAEIGLSAE